ncbi:MAG: S49 family peptidase, partial [Allgaiera sp.]|nr:S49 family peptidase [Allgaiera sp.]
MHHAQIAQRAFNTPLMVDPAKALAFLSGLGPRITGQEITFQGVDLPSGEVEHAALAARPSLFGNDLAQRHQRNGSQPFATIDGIAVIEIAGTLVHRGAWIGQSSGLTSYEGIAAQLQAAVADPVVRGIALDIDSFGGEVAGAFDLADRIRAARAQKPVQAFVAEHALSAGYVLASQADRIILPRTGAVGSIGVVALHTDMSGALDQKGIAVTLIHVGSHKVDANPYQPLPEAVHNQMQRELEVVRFLFAETVAAGRGDRLTQAAALATEAAVFRGADAIAAGLADEIADPVSAFHAFAATPRVSNPS